MSTNEPISRQVVMATLSRREPALGSPFSMAAPATAVVDPQGLVRGWNHAAEELLGFSPEEVLGKPVRKFFVPLDGNPLFDPNLRLERWGETRILRHRDGRPIRAVLYVPELGPSDRSVSWVIIVVSAEEMDRWIQDQSILAGLFTQAPVGLTVYGPDGRVRWYNGAVERMGMGAENWIGRHPGEIARNDLPGGEMITPEFQGQSWDDIIARVLSTGEPIMEVHYRGPLTRGGTHDRVWSCSYFRLQDGQGHVLGVCESAFDVTARYEAQQRRDLLGRCSGLGRTLDVNRTAEELVAITVPDFADGARVELIESAVVGREVPPWRADRPQLRLAAESVPSAGTVRTFIRSSPPEAEDGSQTIVLPLRTGEAALGQVTFSRGPTRDPFSSLDTDLAEEIVSQAAVAIDNARRYAHERSVALTLQRDLLPQALAMPSTVSVAHHYTPTAGPLGVGGDWYDVIQLSGLRVGLVVGDVVGHGLHAAATMGRLRTTTRALARLDLAPDELLSRLDDLVAQGGMGFGPGPDETEDYAVGARCLYAVYDPVSRLCTVASAGHLPPLIVNDGAAVTLDVPVGLPLGIGGMPYETTEFKVADDSLLVMFTDGLVAGGTHPDAEAGTAELCQNLTSASVTSPGTARDVMVAWHANNPAPDDAVVLVAQAHAVANDHVASRPVSPDPADVAAVRAWTLGCLAAWELDELSFVVELIVSELATNAIRYGRQPAVLRLLRDRDRALICEVSDSGHTSPHLRRAGPDDEGGRGLFLVAQLTDHWGTRYTRDGKTIWTELPTASG